MIYKTKGVCSTQIEINVNGDTIENVKFVAGCPGNLLGISSIVKGMKVDEVINKFKGIRCGSKQTSCPDQLSKALEAYKSLKK
ncbi:TIGR03905 family TSCPD domain-containing protein [Clostridium polynesiense]|uniref:TIGR03905 family TSCPD domain-containing protein n=1 Tax=Clostridium polynesiense TaxID=1325933 RepID=UPI0005907A75|nr:TIGR03905 family TSCPD domain-containing protein [Clostridium polynesiense]